MVFDSGFICNLNLKTGEFVPNQMKHHAWGMCSIRSVNYINLPRDEILCTKEVDFVYQGTEGVVEIINSQDIS